MNVKMMNKSELRILNNKRRRNRQLRRRITMFSLALCLLISVFVIFKCASANAASKTDKVLYKYYQTIEIGYGETLTEIASRYTDNGKYTTDTFIEEVIHINNLDEDGKIISGNYIIVPYYDEYHG